MSLTRVSLIREMLEDGSRLRQIYGADKVYYFTLGNPVQQGGKGNDHTKWQQITALTSVSNLALPPEGIEDVCPRG